MDCIYGGDNARCGEASPAYPKSEFFRSLFSPGKRVFKPAGTLYLAMTGL
jgi:hypothetical protein